jgi:hypothetical protein
MQVLLEIECNKHYTFADTKLSVLVIRQLRLFGRYGFVVILAAKLSTRFWIVEMSSILQHILG